MPDYKTSSTIYLVIVAIIYIHNQ